MPLLIEKIKELNISIDVYNNVSWHIQDEITKLNGKNFAANPFYTEVDIEILRLRYLERWVEIIKETMNNTNLALKKEEAERFAYTQIIKEIQTLGNALNAGLTGKECKWCKKYIYDVDDFCSPECLELYANDFLKQQDLP
jgi:hypothetical protein